MRDIGVELGDRGYQIHIGENLLNRAGELISRACGGKSAAVITNRRIGALYGDCLLRSLEESGIPAFAVTVPTGERYKTLGTIGGIYEKLLDRKIDRGGVVIGLGGGVIGDMAGFAAATYRRGVDFVQVPTSLLAQVDASVGGKTGVNLSRGKNLVGAFHQPRTVIIDTSSLHTLPARELRSGLAEVIKHAIIRDGEYFQFLEANLKPIRRLEPEVLERTIALSCEIKADVVGQDERESGLRRILNFGHTTAHAVESLTAYRDFRHGEAVAIGMVTAAVLSWKMGLTDLETVNRIARLLTEAGLPTRVPQGLSGERILATMGLDKKVVHGRLNAVLIRSIGSALVTDTVTPDLWLEALKTQENLTPD